MMQRAIGEWGMASSEWAIGNGSNSYQGDKVGWFLKIVTGNKYEKAGY